MARSAALVNGCAQDAAGRRIRRSGGKFGRPAVLFLEVCGEVVPKAIIKREFARDLPRILRVKPELLFAHSRIGRAADAGPVHQSKQEAGVTESDVRAGYRHVLERLSGLVLSKRIRAERVPIDDRRISLCLEFAAKLERV